MLSFQDTEGLTERMLHEVNSYHVPFVFNTSDDVLVDMGANVGAFTMKYGPLFSKVLCYEASSFNFSRLKENLKRFHNTQLNHKAGYCTDNKKLKLRHWNTLGASPLSSGNASVMDCFIDPKTGHGYREQDEFEEVTSISLNSILKQAGGNISLLKCDIEGGEYDFLINANLSNVDYIVIEIHVQLGTKRKALIDKLLSDFTPIHGSLGIRNDRHIVTTLKNRRF